MFSENFKAVVCKLSLKAREDKSRNVLARILEPQFRTEFTPDMARGLGDAAIAAQKNVADHGMKRATLSIDALVLHVMVFAGSEQHTIKECKGTSAVVSRDKDDGPVVKFGLSFSMTDEATTFFSRKLGQEVTLRIKRSQLSLPATEAPKKEVANKETAKKALTARVEKAKKQVKMLNKDKAK